MPELGRVKKSVKDQRKYGPKASGPEPKPPEELTDAEFTEWSRVTDILRRRKLLDALDQAALHDYIVCWGRLRECEADIKARGVLVQGDRGLVKNPSIQIARTYRDAMLAWSKEFGLTVGSRTRLAIPPDTPKGANNPWEKFPMIDDPIERALCGPDADEEDDPWANL
jgi:P27 family predicted phage terminase small subunit